MDKIYNKNKSKPLSPNDLRVSGGGGGKKPLSKELQPFPACRIMKTRVLCPTPPPDV